MIDFLIHEMDDRSAKVLFLVGNEKSNDPRAGNEIVVYSCQLFDRNPYVENADHSIKLLSSFERLHHGRESSLEIIGIPYLTKQLHRIELKVKNNLFCSRQLLMWFLIKIRNNNLFQKTV